MAPNYNQVAFQWAVTADESSLLIRLRLIRSRITVESEQRWRSLSQLPSARHWLSQQRNFPKSSVLTEVKRRFSPLYSTFVCFFPFHISFQFSNEFVVVEPHSHNYSHKSVTVSLHSILHLIWAQLNTANTDVIPTVYLKYLFIWRTRHVADFPFLFHFKANSVAMYKCPLKLMTCYNLPLNLVCSESLLIFLCKQNSHRDTKTYVI